MPTVQCPHCTMQVENDGTLAGQVVSCPSCQGQFQMPALQQAKRKPCTPGSNVTTPFDFQEESQEPLIRHSSGRQRRRQTNYNYFGIIALVVGFLILTAGVVGLWSSGLLHQDRKVEPQAAATNPNKTPNTNLQALERQYEELKSKLANLQERQRELKRIKEVHNASWDSESSLGAVPPDRLAARTKQVNDDAGAIVANGKEIIATYDAMKTLLDQIERESDAASQKIALWERRQQLQLASESTKQPTLATGARSDQPSQNELAADFQRRVTTYQAGMRDRPRVWKGTDNKWRRSVSTVYEFRPAVKPSTQAGYVWVAELYYKEVSKSTSACETEGLAKAAFLTENLKIAWEHWRLFGYKDGKWERIDRRIRTFGIFNTDWTEAAADNPVLVIEDEFFADRTK